MKRLGMMAAAAFLSAGLAQAAEQTVSYKSGGETVLGFLATPDGKGPFPAMLVIQEWWGLNDWVKDQARALAREGYVALATEEPGLAAVVAYYGAPPSDEAAIARIKAPVLGNFGGEDKGPSPEQVKAFEAAMKKAGKTVDVKVYPGAGHAFANVNNPWKGYKEDAAKDAWARTVAFLARNLKKG